MAEAGTGLVDPEAADVAACLVCGTELTEDEGTHCDTCTRKYPRALLKAHSDHPWDYILKLRTGETWRFAGAEIHGDYTTLTLGSFAGVADVPPHAFERGVDVRIQDIVWCADAPDGS